MALQWLSLIGAIWLQSINGTNSNFPSYSSELKKLLSISQLQLNNLAFASDAGKLLGWISGIAAAHLPLWLVLLIGSFLGLIGYGLQFLCFTNQISSVSYWHIFLLTVLAGNSICWINTVCYIIAIKNFPYDRQIAVGISTSYVGLSAKIYTDLVDVTSTSHFDRAKMFLFMNSLLPLMVCFVAAPLVKDVSVVKTRVLGRGFFILFFITILTGFFAVVSSLGYGILRFLSPFMKLVGISVFFLLPLVIPLVEKVVEKVQHKCLIRVHDDEGFNNKSVLSIENGEKLDDEVNNNNNNNNNRGDFLEHRVKEEIGPKVMLRRVEFWLYFFVYFFGATLGLVYLNNLGQIAESRGCSRTSSLVSLSSAFSFFGRLLPSLHDYFFSRSKFTVSRSAAMGLMMVPMCGAFFLLINEKNMSLYISTAVIGICTGAITSISVPTTIELFGTKNFGVNHNILVSNIPIGSFMFGDFAALLYKRGRISGEENCMGYQCYQTSFIIWGSLCALGTLLAFLLHARTKKLY
ncbi:hypothetical protein ACJIZ3_012430 [Penstemon smallii]|uniref:Nodulin-like domain-containing protein n=1 Tax=Penstemon smallii TaxID=265156 RepID=A0ABD3UR97_9LAMI